jgi:hypothetical protein
MRNISEGHYAAPGFDPLAKAEIVGFFRSIDDFERLEADARRLLQELNARTTRRTYIEGTQIKERAPNAPPIPAKRGRKAEANLPKAREETLFRASGRAPKLFCARMRE